MICSFSDPEPIGIAATYDRELIHSTAATTSDEARAFSNVNRAGLDFWSDQITTMISLGESSLGHHAASPTHSLLCDSPIVC